MKRGDLEWRVCPRFPDYEVSSSGDLRRNAGAKINQAGRRLNGTIDADGYIRIGTAPDPFGNLRMFGYNLIYADPAWPFDNYSTKGESRNPNRHYDTMAIEQIKALPVGQLASDNCALFLWVTDPLLDRGIEVMKHWGFAYKSVGFTWAKRTRLDTGWHMGTGYTTRSNPEMCLIGMMGSLARLSAGVRQLIVEPVREHSRKPDRVPDDIVKLYGDLPRVELFARTQRPGWDVWGNQVDKFEVAA